MMTTITAMHFFTLALLCLFILLGAHYSDALFDIGQSPSFDSNSYGVQLSSCPLECDCQGLTVDCSHRGLSYVPRTFPLEVRRLYLDGNNLTVLRQNDFQRLPYLKVLQIMDNQVQTLEPGVFDDLKSLERLWLSRNHLRYIPDNVFIKNFGLHLIDLSHNRLMGLTSNVFYGLKSLKSLHLDNNRLSCIEDGTFSKVKELEFLTLNKNNLTTLAYSVFDGLATKLKTLHIADNPFRCDCSMAWLVQWFRKLFIMQHKQSSQQRFDIDSAKCVAPFHLFGMKISSLSAKDFHCDQPYYDEFLQNDDAGMAIMRSCRIEPQCPYQCSCQDGVIDCRNRNLTRIPNFIPDNAIEIRLEQNSITEVPSRAFSSYRQLGRIDLSKNNISRIAEDAFHGLKSLNALFLFGNEITDLPEALFKGLANIQLLLLNKNRIKCLRRGIFADLKHLNLLSLYDNNIQSLAEGIFDPLINIQTLHLGRNPFICDCNLRWLSNYLRERPNLETSDARCEEPKRNSRKRLTQLNPERFRCKGTEELRTKYSAQCMDNKCPKNCVCEGTIVDCSRLDLHHLPEDVPTFATELRLTDNRIRRLTNSNYFKRLPNLLKLDLRNNKLNEIQDGSLHGADMLQDLLLSNNQLRQISPKMFANLRNLTTLVLHDNQITCITNDTFADLENLRYLSLNDNKIRCITSGAFDKLRSLLQVNLQNNPFNCNCHLRWMSSWIRKKSNNNKILIGNIRCYSPANVANVPIEDVEPGDFRCDEDEEEAECGPDGLCPSRCTCSGTVVRCSRQKLKRVPKYIPTTTTELYLDMNEISLIPTDLNRLSELNLLDLSNNQVNILPTKIFENMTKLHTLIISYNKLQCIQPDAFKGLMSLRKLTLHGNDISLIPTGSFDSLNVITHLAIGENPFYCDCNMRWLAEWIQKTNTENGIARCIEPSPMRGKLLMSALPNHFICASKTEPHILAKCDACYTFPCKNGATCISQPMHTYECMCAPGFHGTNCEYKIDACFGNPCDNGGTCKVLETGRFSCHCPTGYKGHRCEIDVDECAEDNKCQNNSTCIDDIGSYRCECLSGYSGFFCEKKIEYCMTREWNPCQNKAKCIRDEVNDYYNCECAPGWTGQNCTDNQDDCLVNECQNGATCLDKISGYECQCPVGYSGQFCEYAPNVDLLYQQTSPCQHHDCKHGVCFLPPGSSDYQCKCSPGYTGKRCDVISSVSFRSGSYIELVQDMNLQSKPTLSIKFKFITKKENGILFYLGSEQGHHLSAELFRGRIRISLNVGNYPVSTMFSYEKVNDGRFHQVNFELIKKNFTMIVDDGSTRTIINEGKNEYLDVENQPFYIGGMPKTVGNKVREKWHIWNDTSFEGCMKELYINSNPPDLNQARQKQDIIIGGDGSCEDYEQPKPVDACHANLCQHGKCVPSDDGQSYHCRCKLGYSGPFCDQAPTCQKEIKRDFYYENSCRSTKKLKMAICVGSCGEAQCRAQKTKKRSIKLACNDGSKYTKQIEIIRKCGCSAKSSTYTELFY
ncbi:slit guidance ligand [Dermatophagoides farinae]